MSGYMLSYQSGSRFTLPAHMSIADAMYVDGMIYLLFKDEPSAPKFEREYVVKLLDEYHSLEDWTPISLARYYNKVAYIAIQEVVEKGE